MLVGDPDQLSSVDAGAVLSDMVQGFADRPENPVARLVTTHRYGSGIDNLAQALRDRDADRAMEVLSSGAAGVSLVDPDDEAAMAAFHEELLDAALAVRVHAEEGNAPEAVRALDAHRLLCAHREGPFGVAGWNRQVERLISERTGVTHYEEWYAGRPVLINANDRSLGIYNGDMGVTVLEPGGRLRVHVPTVDGLKAFATTRLSDVQTVYAMTVHKSQGSQARSVSVVMPPEDSPLLTRELFYTAVTRAQERVRVVGTEAAIRAAIGREVQRATGLQGRLSTR